MGYTTDQKASAIAIVRQYGENSQEARNEIREVLGISPSKATVHNWLARFEIELGSEKLNQTELVKKERRYPTIEEVETAEDDLEKLYEKASKLYLQRAVDTVKTTDGKDSMTAAGIATDKLLKLRQVSNIPPELLKLLPEFIELASANEKTAVGLMLGMIEVLKKKVTDDAISDLE